MPNKDVKFLLSATDRTTAVFRGVTGNLDRLDRTANAVNGSIGRIGSVLGGAFAAGTITAFFGAVANGLDRLNDLKDATGATVPNLSALEDVALRTGTSFEGMAGTLIKFNKVLNEAEPGSRTERVLQSIGLNAKELRALDPAEALRRTAVALAGYAADGDKARVVQELFGKSIREAGPFLDELAKQSRLVATVTAKEAEAAELFNKQLAGLQKNASDTARILGATLIPKLSSILEIYNKLGALGVLKFVVGADNLAVARREAEGLDRAMTSLGAQLERAVAQGDEKKAAGLRADLERLQKRALDVTAKLKGETDAVLGSAADVESDNELRRRFSGNQKLKSPATDADVAAAKARTQARLAAEKLMWQQIREFDEQQEKERFDREGIVQKADIERDKATAEARKLLEKQVNDFTDQQREEHDERERTAAEKQAEVLSDFALEARRNIQDATADTIESALEGDFDRIEKLWGNLLKRMVAQALAADLNKFLFGKTGTAGDTGQLGILFTLFGARAEGGPVMGSHPYLVGERGPEIFIPSQSGQVLSNEQSSRLGGRSVTLAPTYQISVDSRADRAAVQRDIVTAVNEGNRRLVGELRAAGVM